MSKLRTHLPVLLGSLAAGFVVSAFWDGFHHATGPFGGRVAEGLLWILLSAAKGGRPTLDPARTVVVDAWPLALLLAAALASRIYALRARRRMARA